MSEILEALEIEIGDEPDATIVWLHGLGADGHDFEPIVPALALPEALAVRFVFPHAPKRPVTINMGMVMRAWYDVPSLQLDHRQDERGIRQSAALIESLLERERKRGIAPGRTVIAGFSQGGAIAYHVGLRHAERLAGVMVLSAYLPLHETLAVEAATANRDVPILQCHGTFDAMVPSSLGQRSAEHVRTLGYAVDFRTYPCEHSLHPREVTDIGAFLTRVLVAP